MITSVDFTEVQKPTLERMKQKLRKDPVFLAKTLWSDKFKLPPNDERLLQLRVTEALEQVLALEALEEFRSEAHEREAFRALALAGGDITPYMKKEVRRDEEARSIADTPHLTGDPEWDAVELEMTDPSRQPLSDDWMRGG